MKYQIIFNKKSQKQLKTFQKDKEVLAKVLQILGEIEQNPYSPNYKFERLKGNLSGFCSKRIDKKNRLV